MAYLRGPFAPEADADGRDCPRCEEWFRSEDGVTSLESARVFLCRPCSQAEERDARMVGRGEEACAS